jgi:O-antigen ligase
MARRLAINEKTPLFPAILEMGWLLIALVTPLWINLWGSQPFDPAKLSLLRGILCLLLGVWLADWLRRPRPWRQELPPPPILWPLLALIVTAVLSTVTSINPGLSLWGSQQRAGGLLTLLSYLLLALLVAARLRTVAQARRLLAFLVATAVPIILLGSLQAAGQDPLRLVSDARSPVYATLGRANFVGAYLALLLPLTVALAMTTTRRALRVGLLLLAGAQLILIGLTLARAAWLAAVVGLVLVLVGWVWPLLSHRGRVVVGSGIGLAAIGGGLLAARSLFLADAGSVAARRVIWQGTWGLIGERPLLGHGLDSLAIQFARVFPPELVYYQGRQVFVDRAHNWLLDTAVTTGLLGLAALIWLWAALFWWGGRAIRRYQAHGQPEKRLLLVGCLAALAANLTGNLFSFDVATTAVAGWLLVAVVISLTRAGEGAAWELNPARWRLGLAGLLLIGAVGVGWGSSGRFLIADAAYQRSLEASAGGNWPGAGEAAEQAVARWPQEPVYWQQLAWTQAAGGDWPRAAASWQQATQLRPTDPAVWAAKAQFYLELAEQGELAFLQTAEEAASEAIRLAPTIARLYLIKGRVYLLAGQWPAAVGQLAQAVDLDATDGLAWALLAETYAAQGQFAQAEAAWQEAERWR